MQAHDAGSGRACVECGKTRPADYTGWRGPRSQWCSKFKCRQAAEAAARELRGEDGAAGGCSSKDERIAELKAHVAAQDEIIAMLKQQLQAYRCGHASVGVLECGSAHPPAAPVPAARLTMSGGSGDRSRSQPAAAPGAPTKRVPLAVRSMNSAAEPPPKQSKPAELPPGWIARQSRTTGQQIWEHKVFGLRLDVEPPMLERDSKPYVQPELILEIVRMLKAKNDTGKPIGQPRVRSVFEQCMGLISDHARASHVDAFDSTVCAIKKRRRPA